MHFRETPFGFFLVLDRGDELIDALTSFAARSGTRAASLSGLGVVGKLTMGFYDLAAQQYERRSWIEELEVAALVGNLAEVDGGPFPHVHGVFGRRDFSSLSGHVFEAVVSVTLEIAVFTAPEPMHRRAVDFCDLKLIEL